MKSVNKKLLIAPSLALVGMMALSSVAVPVRTFARAETSAVTKYESSYESKDAAREAGLALNSQIAEEGAVLLKNENNVLPLKVTATPSPTDRDPDRIVYSDNRISVFGYNSFHPLGGGSANDVEASAGRVTFSSNYFDSFEDAHYAINPRLRGLYEGTTSNSGIIGDGDIDIENYSLPSFLTSYEQYNDAAVIILGDSSGTGAEHSFDYSNEQKEMVNFVADHFDKVVVILNKSVPMQIDWLKKHEGVDSILLVGEGGTNGLDVVGHILCGDVNPSGRLVDTYDVSHSSNPSYNNYNKLASFSNADSYMGIYRVEGQNENSDTYMIEYEEGIYVGYKYYETRGWEEGGKTGDWSWYDENVSYTFGYGLSYTDFTWELQDTSTAAGAITANGTIKFDVKVTNTGTVAGKDVVELYYTAPYTSGGIEKSHVELGAFAKTDLLEPNASQTLTLEIKVEDMASYDYNDANDNGNCGYELDAGTYSVKLMKNAHDVVTSREYTLAETANVREEAHNLFPDSNTYADEKFDHKLSRADFEGTFPTPLFSGEAADSPTVVPISAEEYAKFTPTIENNDQDVMPTQANADTRPAEAAVKLADLAGKSYDDPMWEQLLNQLTVDEMANLIQLGGFHSEALDYIGKPFALDTDGPLGWTGTGVSGDPYNRFCSEPVIASTWNADLCYQLGVMIGEQGLWGNSDRTDGGYISGYTGWYAPGMNIHRSPYDARYTEYYSEDGLLVGKIVAGVSKGLKSKGGYLFIKHFALHNDGYGVMNSYRGMMNDSKTSGLAVWADEQTMREIYFKGFEIAVKEGEAQGAMSAFNRIGYEWAGACKALLTDLLRDEWGFKGMVITDLICYGSQNFDAMIRAGGDLALESSINTRYGVALSDASLKTATGVKAMRNATKNILWTVLNSNAMQVPQGAKIVKLGVGTAGLATVGTAYSATLGGDELFEVNTEYKYGDINYTATGLPGGLSIDSKTGVVSGTPTEAGAYEVTVTASADGYASETQTYSIVVVAAAQTPGDEDKTSGCEGCGSAIGLGTGIMAAAGMLTVFGAAVIVRKKAKKD